MLLLISRPTSVYWDCLFLRLVDCLLHIVEALHPHKAHSNLSK